MMTTLFQLPYNSQLSDSCRDLLHRLLQRDVKQRITYKEFLQHPFIDMDHRPCAGALPKAVSLKYDYKQDENRL